MDENPSTRIHPVTGRLIDEGLVSVVKAARDAGISISSKTALRWCLAGVRGIRLESVKVGGRRMTSRAALRRFVAATQGHPASQQPIPCFDASTAERVLESFDLGRSNARNPGP